MKDKVFRNKSGGFIKVVSATALDYRAQYLDDDSVQFSITKDELTRYWTEAGFSHVSSPATLPVRKLIGNLNES